jgi:short-subunit dehydrogenase
LEAVPACDVLINNAGFANYGEFAKLTEQQILEEIHLDVVALTRLTRRYLPEMIARKSGKVLNVASTAAFVPGPTAAVYYASKAFVLSLSEALAYELRGTGVTVTCLCPGPTATGFQEHAKAESLLLFRLPLADAAKVAKAGIDGMMRGKAVVVPGVANKLVAFSPKISPRNLLLAISAKLLQRT